ncbi:MAG: cation:proton antiporter [Haliscomenobacter sp.]|nr:cation:proton antiporter [Haliscomenobacter sp.]MBK8880165.1 cation:proton antiporter [Haliscomenobacter sp.]
MQTIWERVQEAFHLPFTNGVLVFALLLFIILAVPLAFRRIGIPGIIGLIISGVVIGPHGFHILDKTVAVDLFATIGLLYIMFVAGLELDLIEFRKNRHKSAVFGGLTFLIPLAIGLPVCYYLLGYSFETSLLTAGMFSTHTLVAYPIASRLGIVKHESVALTVGGTIITDTAVLLLLPVITASAQGHSSLEVWKGLMISAPIFLLVVLFAVPRFSRWFLKSAGSEPYSQYVFVLATVFFVAFLSELAGLEPIIGAFAAGLALNRLIPHTSPLMNRVEFVGNALFIPIFLISVGMIINLDVLTQGPKALIVATALTAVALAGKWLAAGVTSWVFGYSSAERQLIFGLSSSHAAATLAIIMVGFRLEIIDENILNGTILLILVTCMVASFVTEHYGKKVALAEALQGTPAPASPEESILVPIANPETMEGLIDLALMLKKPKDKRPLTGLSVVMDDLEARDKLAEARKLLDKALAHGAASGQTIEIISTIDQNAANGIRRVAVETDATDIVLGHSAKANLMQLIFGKTNQNIVEMSRQAVWIYRLSQPLNLTGAIQLFCPSFCELEYGFGHWIEKISRLSGILSRKIVCYGEEATFESIRSQIQKNKLGGTFEFKAFRDWKHFEELTPSFHLNDLIVLVSPREGDLSHLPALESISKHLDEYLPQSSYLLIYPPINPEWTEENSDHLFI